MFSPTLAVTGDSVDTISIAAAGTHAVTLAGMTQVKFVVISSDQQLTVTATPTGGSGSAIKGKNILIDDTDLSGISLNNTSSSTATVRVLIGGS